MLQISKFNLCAGSIVVLNDSTVVKKFSYNYYIPNGKCSHTEDERYCVLVKCEDFCTGPEQYIEQAFRKKFEPIAQKVKVYPDYNQSTVCVLCKANRLIQRGTDLGYTARKCGFRQRLEFLKVP
jgi:hypothetical protein